MYSYVSEYHSYVAVFTRIYIYHSHMVVCTCLLLLVRQIARDRWRDQFLICQQR